MSDFMADLSGLLADKAISAVQAKNSTNRKAGSDLEMTDFLQLMVASFQNQSIDDVASTNDMMNQMMQMSVIQAVTSLTNMISESTSLSYAASLVGKEVTIGQMNANGTELLGEIVGTVTGTGTVGGQQVVFVNGESYYLTDIMAVGRLPGSEEAVPLAAGEETEAEGEYAEDAGIPVDFENAVWNSSLNKGDSSGDSSAAGVSAGVDGLDTGAASESEAAREAQQQAMYGDGFVSVTGVEGLDVPTNEMMEAAAEQMYETSL